MPKATLTKRLEFCSSHRYHNPDWDDAKNRAVFGPCNNENSHGHNYLLEVTLCGEIDPINGMIMNLYDLKPILIHVLEEFDHKYLNLDTPYFIHTIPTTENLALTLWNILGQHPELPHLDMIRLYEDDRLYAEVSLDLFKKSSHSVTPEARITRRYHFSAAHHVSKEHITGHNYTVGVTIQGHIDPQTGQITNINTLDQLFKHDVLERFEGKDLSRDRAFQDSAVTEGTLAQVIGETLVHKISQGQVAEVKVCASRSTEAAYTPPLSKGG